MFEVSKEQFEEQGYVIIRGLFSPAEVEKMLDTFMKMHAGGPIAGCYDPVPSEEAGGDILKLFPRMMHPHKVNDQVMAYMLNSNVMDVISVLLGEEALAGQSMFYFKPPGAKGQALHQDNFYMKVEPGTCIAAWVALDPADEENGGLVIVPKSSQLEIQCPQEANPELSFTRDEVAVPEGMGIVPIAMQPGDVLFFNGNVIHGSYPNRSTTRFRRSFICHYAGESLIKVGHHFSPLFSRDGHIIEKKINYDSGPCGGEDFAGPH